MYSVASKLDRDVARAFLNAPSKSLSYTPMTMNSDFGQRMIGTFPRVDNNENFPNSALPPPHPNARLGRPTHQNIIPMYYDVIIDTVTDYDIFYPIAKQTEKYYHDSTNSDQPTIDNHPTPNYPRHQAQRLDELAVSVDFPYDCDRSGNWSNHSIQSPAFQNKSVRPTRTVRFPDYPIDVLPSNQHIEHSSTALDPYYFHPETISKVDDEQQPARYLTTPFFWFRPVLHDNHAICIPTSHKSLHAYVTPLFELQSTPNSIRL